MKECLIGQVKLLWIALELIKLKMKGYQISTCELTEGIL